MLIRIKEKIIHLWYLYIKRDRIAYAKYLGVRLGSECLLMVDPYVAFGSEPWLIKMGNHVEITKGVRFLNHEGGMWTLRGMDSEFQKFDFFLPISVGDNVMIGTNSLIMPGVNIGSNVIVGGGGVS